MRIALFSDIHSNYHALEAVLQDMARRGVDRMLCLGDITLKGPLPKDCVDRVRDLNCPVVLGNTDIAYHPDYHPSKFPPQNESQKAALADFDRHFSALSEADRKWLAGFPLALSETWEGVRLDFFHATPTHNYVLTLPWASNDQLATLRISDETQVSAFGHCHRAFVRTAQGRLVVNVGSVGLPFDGDPRPSYVLLDLENGSMLATVVRVAFDPEPAIKTARDVGMKGWQLFELTMRTGIYPG